MKQRIIRFTIITATLMALAGQSIAAGSANTAVSPSKAVSAQKVSASEANKVVKQADMKLIDINRAKKEQLMTLPGITEAEAAKIIAGRPYGSKAHLATRKILTREIYEGLKGLVIAKQSSKDATKNAAQVAPKK